jgi:hypothetical protein
VLRDQIGFVSQNGAVVILGLFLLLPLFAPHPGPPPFSSMNSTEWHTHEFRFVFRDGSSMSAPSTVGMEPPQTGV